MPLVMVICIPPFRSDSKDDPEPSWDVAAKHGARHEVDLGLCEQLLEQAHLPGTVTSLQVTAGYKREFLWSYNQATIYKF